MVGVSIKFLCIKYLLSSQWILSSYWWLILSWTIYQAVTSCIFIQTRHFSHFNYKIKNMEGQITSKASNAVSLNVSEAALFVVLVIKRRASPMRGKCSPSKITLIVIAYIDRCGQSISSCPLFLKQGTKRVHLDMCVCACIYICPNDKTLLSS